MFIPNPYLVADPDTLEGSVSVTRDVEKRKRARKRKLSGNVRLDPSLHSAVIGELLSLLSRDGSYEANYLAEVLLSKYVGPDTDSAELRKSRAIDKWLATELRNRKTNWRIIQFDPIDSDVDLGWVKMSKLVSTIRAVISKIIGAEPPEDVLYGTFTGGASTSKSRNVGVIFTKFASQADVTAEAYDTLKQVVSSCEVWRLCLDRVGSLEPRIVEGNVLFTVPKTSTIDRVAAKEPDLNCFAQKGIGDFIRRSLRKEGIDLNDQSVNRSLAKQGSIDGKLATLDLSSASDSVTTQLVYLLLPPKWAVLMDTVRSQRTVLPDGTIHYNEMFSSMGNAFTFELESLLFYSIVRACCYHSGVKGRVSVYGDDIICPSSVARRVARLFNWFGFTVNPSKSFWSGRFRESCGGHYYRGRDVTPFYVKEPIATCERLVHFLNRLRKWAGTGFLRDGYYELWVKYSKYVGNHLHGGWNVESPHALVSPRIPGKRTYRLSPISLPVMPLRPVMGEIPWHRREGYVSVCEQDAIQLGGYLFALRSRDGFCPTLVPYEFGNELGQIFFETPSSGVFDIPVDYRGWEVKRNDPPSWVSGRIPLFPEE